MQLKVPKDFPCPFQDTMGDCKVGNGIIGKGALREKCPLLAKRAFEIGGANTCYAQYNIELHIVAKKMPTDFEILEAEIMELLDHFASFGHQGEPAEKVQGELKALETRLRAFAEAHDL